MFNKLNLPQTVTALSVSLLLSFSAQAVETNSSSVQQPSNSSTSQETTVVEFGPYKVNVPKGGYYDRFRMNPNLDEVAKILPLEILTISVLFPKTCRYQSW